MKAFTFARARALGEDVGDLGTRRRAVLFDQVCRDRPVSRAGVLPEARDRVRSRETGFRDRFSLNRHPSES